MIYWLKNVDDMAYKPILHRRNKKDRDENRKMYHRRKKVIARC
jgi:hypothetical protein